VENFSSEEEEEEESVSLGGVGIVFIKVGWKQPLARVIVQPMA
jgi:hypothetical protein